MWSLVAVIRTVDPWCFAKYVFYKKKYFLTRGHKLTVFSLRRTVPFRRAVFHCPFNFHTLNTGCCSNTDDTAVSYSTPLFCHCAICAVPKQRISWIIQARCGLGSPVILAKPLDVSHSPEYDTHLCYSKWMLGLPSLTSSHTQTHSTHTYISFRVRDEQELYGWWESARWKEPASAWEQANVPGNTQ